VKTKQRDIFNDCNELICIEVSLENNTHLFDAAWDAEDPYTNETIKEFRDWVNKMIIRKGHTV
jgi:hypothetical protein